MNSNMIFRKKVGLMPIVRCLWLNMDPKSFALETVLLKTLSSFESQFVGALPPNPHPSPPGVPWCRAWHRFATGAESGWPLPAIAGALPRHGCGSLSGAQAPHRRNASPPLALSNLRHTPRAFENWACRYTRIRNPMPTKAFGPQKPLTPAF